MRKQKRRCGLQLTERDRNILRTLWRWKLLTTSAIAYEFFGREDSDAAYLRMRRLSKLDFVRQVELGVEKKYVWTLGLEGFAELKCELPELQQEGFRSEYPYHDFWCTAFQRGPLVGRTNEWHQRVSEQQLRRSFPEYLPKWVPDTATHRPDGFSRIQIGGDFEIVAFEIELNAKTPSRYDRVFSYYKARKNIYRVVWMVRTAEQADTIQRLALDYDSEEYRIHLFVLLSDFRKNLWSALFYCGQNRGLPVKSLLLQKPSLFPHFRETRAGIDLSERPYNCVTSLARRKNSARDCIAFHATLSLPTQQDLQPVLHNALTTFPNSSSVPKTSNERRS